MNKPIILTGIRSNDEPHIGNYLGAILPMVELQRKYAGQYQIYMFVPDLHSFTTPVDHAKLYVNTHKNLRYFLAAGLDIANSDTYIYRQSFVPAHSELAWILNCFTGFGELSRMTQFKDKVQGESTDQVSVGLFTYPVLMAADILLYGPAYVPLGDDQQQHLELARDIGARMNNRFGEGLFDLPKDWKAQQAFMGRDEGVRIRSLRTPEKKMSKSVNDPAGTILMSDDPAAAYKKVMAATTDSLGVIAYDFEKRPGISNLLQMLALLGGRSVHQVRGEWEGKTRYGELKTAVAEVTAKFLTEFQSALAAADESFLMDELERNETVIAKVAAAKLVQVQQVVGLRPQT